MSDIPILLLAAGASNRMRGRDKLMEEVDGQPLVARMARMARAATDGAVLVTLPPQPHPRHGALKGLDTRLIACLDDALSAGDPATRAQKQKDAAGLIDGYIKAIDDNPVIGLIDDNPFHPVTVRRALETSLTALRAQLT